MSGLRGFVHTGRLNIAEARLEEAVYRFDKWSFGNSPAEDRADKARIHGLIRKVERLGGDAQEVVSGATYRHDMTYLCAEAMPETFERVQKYGRRVAVRRNPIVPAACEECHGEGHVPVPGYSVNPASGMLGPDPQAVGEAVCPACGGSGAAETENE